MRPTNNYLRSIRCDLGTITWSEHYLTTDSTGTDQIQTPWHIDLHRKFEMVPVYRRVYVRTVHRTHTHTKPQLVLRVCPSLSLILNFLRVPNYLSYCNWFSHGYLRVLLILLRMLSKDKSVVLIYYYTMPVCVTSI